MSRSTARSRLLSAPAIAAMAGGLLLLLIAVFAETVWGAAATTTSVPDRLQGPSLDHPFGTDDLGRDVFARVLVAARLSLLLTFGATAIGMTGGIVIGLLA
ncbi:MAG: ATP-binding cassette protein, partial [Microbacterium sp.]|nr:ATP-binding cassette protein [Microbacterium sp.]